MSGEVSCGVSQIGDILPRVEDLKDGFLLVTRLSIRIQHQTAAMPRASLTWDVLEILFRRQPGIALEALNNESIRLAVVAGLRDNVTGRGLNVGQAIALLRVIYQKRSIFLSGGAGVGKTFTVKRVVQAYTERRGISGIAVACSTGVAAVQASIPGVSAKTLHMTFNIRSVDRDPRGEPYKVPPPKRVYFSSDDCEEEATIDAEQFNPVTEQGDLEDAETSKNPLNIRMPTIVLDHHTIKFIEQLKLLIIDEVSMVNSEMMQLIDETMRHVRSSHLPFGGCLVIAVGDLCQLPPVVVDEKDIRRMTNRYGGVWCFQAPSWQSLTPVKLTKVVRQSDPSFAGLLNRMRLGQNTAGDQSVMKQQYVSPSSSEGVALLNSCRLVIFPSNKARRAHNTKRFGAVSLGKQVHSFHPESRLEGRFADRSSNTEAVDLLDSERFTLAAKAVTKSTRVNTDEEPHGLQLCVDARVQCIRNIYTTLRHGGRSLVVGNGQLGTVVGFAPHPHTNSSELLPIVLWDATGAAPANRQIMGRERRCTRQKTVFTREFETTNAKGNSCVHRRKLEVYSVVSSLPLELGWAVTIHKAQGCTLRDDVCVKHDGRTKRDGHWMANPGAAYVALSRAESIGLIHTLTPFNVAHAAMDRDVQGYMQSAGLM